MLRKASHPLNIPHATSGGGDRANGTPGGARGPNMIRRRSAASSGERAKTCRFCRARSDAVRSGCDHPLLPIGRILPERTRASPP